ncbi:phage protein [Clostridium perfringens]|nr:phage protein [Clostridium perfringens]
MRYFLFYIIILKISCYKKLNMVNQRREFFNVTLEEIEKVVKENFDKTVEFKKEPEAEQFRQSLKIKDTVLTY